MDLVLDVLVGAAVALLAEGVDRNSLEVVPPVELLPSPSSRRAWIEIVHCSFPRSSTMVALLAEGVDRNRKMRC